MNESRAKLDEIIKMLQHHEKMMSDYQKLSMRHFTYESKEFHSCLICGHSDKALIYELKKLRKML